MKNFNWNYPTTMWVGENRIKDLGLACRTLNMKKPLLITDSGLVNLEIVKKTLEMLNNENIFTEIFQMLQAIQLAQMLTMELYITKRKIAMVL